MRIACLILSIIASVATVQAQDRKATVELISNTAAVAPGKPFTVALRFQIQPGWHLYWQNPGDTGAPPKAKWTLPDGYTAGSLEFPVPHRIDAGDGLTAFGYQDELVLLSTITPPAVVDKPLEISARVTWVICKDVCIAERQDVTLTLPAGKATSERREDFKKWIDQQPKRPGADSDHAVNVASWGDDKTSGMLLLKMKPGEKLVEFFPPKSDFLVFEKPSIRDTNNGPQTGISFKILPGAHERLAAPVVLVIESEGRREAIEVPCTIEFPS